jgi:hypothetical protein
MACASTPGAPAALNRRWCSRTAVPTTACGGRRDRFDEYLAIVRAFLAEHA